MFEIIVVAVALVAVKHFCRTEPKSFDVSEIRTMTRSEFRANAKIRYW